MILPHLVPEFYMKFSLDTRPHSLSMCSIALLYTLLAHFPSQRPYHELYHSIPSSMLPSTSHQRQWISKVARALRTRNYASFNALTMPDGAVRTHFESCIFVLAVDTSQKNEPPFQTELRAQTFRSILHRLRVRSRDAMWNVMRSAYRELSCDIECLDTRNWLIRSLLLDSAAPTNDRNSLDLDSWLAQTSQIGQIRRKEEIEGRWIVCKVR
jgi:hypothetical protein